MSFNPFRLCRDDSSDRGLANRQHDEGDAGHESKVLRTKRGVRKRGVPPTAS